MIERSQALPWCRALRINCDYFENWKKNRPVITVPTTESGRDGIMYFLRSMIPVLAIIALTASPASAYVIIIPKTIYPATLQADGATLSQIHNIAIVSAIGQHLTLQNNHTLRANATKAIDIADWNVDDAVTVILAKYFSAQFTVKPIAIDRAAVASGTHLATSDLVRAAAADSSIDAVVVVHPAEQYEGPKIAGLGLEQDVDDKGAMIWCNFSIELIDAHTGKLLGSAYSRMNEARGPVFVGIRAPTDIAITDELRLEGEMMRKTHAAENFLISHSIIDTVRALHMVLEMPAQGKLVALPPEEDKYKDYHSIAIFSMLGDKAAIETISPDSGAHSIAERSESDWQLDRTIEYRARARLSYRFKVENVSKGWTLGREVKPERDNPASFLAKAHASQNVDLFLIVVRRQPAIADDWERSGGAGVLIRQGDNKSTAFLNYEVVLMDAHTLKILDRQSGTTSTALGGLARQALPDSINLADKHSDASIGAIVNHIAADSLDETLLRMGLVGYRVPEKPTL